MRKIITSGLLLLALATTVNAQQSSTTTVGTLTNITRSQERKIKDEDIISKEISKELAVPKNGDIYIDNSSRGIVVKTWDQQKVKVITTVYYEGESKLTDEEWLEKVNLSLKVLGSSVKIKSGSVGGNGFYSYSTPSAVSGYSYSGGGIAVFNGAGQNIGTKNNVKRTVTVMVPAGSKLDIESKYAEVTLPANIGDLNVDISNGTLEAENLGKLVLRSKYSTVNIGDVKTAEIELINGRFSAKNIDDLDIDSKNATVELGSTKKTEIRSISDEYEFEEAGEIHGRKNYGNLRITKLNNSIELEGANSDVKIRNIATSVTLIKIDDKYADIRLPLKNTKNYSIDYTGAYSAVYGNFEKKAIISEKDPQLTMMSGTLRAADDRKPTITSAGSLSNLTVTGYHTDRSSNVIRDTTIKPYITSVGSLNGLTVTGYVTPTYAYGNGTLTATTVPGIYTPANPASVSGYVTGGAFTQNAYISSVGATTAPTYSYGRGFSSSIGNNDTPAKFTAIVGDGKSLKVEIKCLNCTVDFK